MRRSVFARKFVPQTQVIIHAHTHTHTVTVSTPPGGHWGGRAIRYIFIDSVLSSETAVSPGVIVRPGPSSFRDGGEGVSAR